MSITSTPNYLFTSSGAIIDISNPKLPTLKGSISINGFASGILVEGNYAYYGTGMNVKFVIADISNPAAPLSIGNIKFPYNSGVFGIAKKNEVVYLAAGTSGLLSVDVTDKTNPVVLDSIPVAKDEQIRDVVIKDSLAFAAASEGLQIINIKSPSDLKVIKNIGSGYNSIDIQNNFVFLGKDNGGVDVFNISNPNAPTLAFAIVNSGGTAWDLKVKGNLLYLSTDIKGLFIYKMQNNSGAEVAHFHDADNGQCFSVAVQDDLILLGGLIKGIAILKYDSLGIATNVPDEKQLKGISIFPNPAGSYVEVNKSDNNAGELEVRNMFGQLVLKEACKDNNTHVDISELAIGEYIVTYKDKERVVNEKLVKLE